MKQAGRSILSGLRSLVRIVVFVSLGLLCAPLGSLPAAAELVAADLVEGSGDGLVTLDRETGLAWLDIPLTLGLSVEQALAVFPGFRLARRVEVDALYARVGLGLEPSPGCALCNRAVENFSGARRLLDLMGENPDHPQKWSYHDNYRELAADPRGSAGSPPAVGRSALVIFDCCFPSHAPAEAPFLTDVFVVDGEATPRFQSGGPRIGSYLVREPVEPVRARDADPAQLLAPKRKAGRARSTRARDAGGMRATGGAPRGDLSSKQRRKREKRRKAKFKGVKRSRR